MLIDGLVMVVDTIDVFDETFQNFFLESDSRNIDQVVAAKAILMLLMNVKNIISIRTPCGGNEKVLTFSTNYVMVWGL